MTPTPRATPSAARRVGPFLVAGAAGFLVDAGVLRLLTASADLPELPARLVSIGVALFVTWRINRRFVFRAPGRGTLREFGRYLAVGASTSLLNYAVFAALVVFAGVAALPALAVASLTAMVASYLGYDRLVFGRGARSAGDGDDGSSA